MTSCDDVNVTMDTPRTDPSEDSRPAGRAPRRGGIGWSSRATGQDVAALAGVSPQTVSRVANGATNVRPETRERVLAAMEKVGYAPNAAARNLRAGRSDLIGLVVHHLTRTGEAHVVEGVTATAHARGYSVSLALAASGAAADLNEAIARLQQVVAGIIVVGIDATDVDDLRLPPRLPTVLADSRPLAIPAAGHDQFSGGLAATEHLLSLGHEVVHHIGGPADSSSAQLRASGWRAALDRAGRPAPEILHGDWSPESGYRLGQQLAADPGVTAVFAANDEMAAGLYRALFEAGLRVPDDVSVVGFDDLLGRFLWPSLTSVQQDFSHLGESLIELLMEQIASPRRGPRLTGQRVIPSTLMVRESTAPLRWVGAEAESSALDSPPPGRPVTR